MGKEASNAAACKEAKEKHKAVGKEAKEKHKAVGKEGKKKSKAAGKKGEKKSQASGKEGKKKSKLLTRAQEIAAMKKEDDGWLQLCQWCMVPQAAREEEEKWKKRLSKQMRRDAEKAEADKKEQASKKRAETKKKKEAERLAYCDRLAEEWCKAGDRQV